MNIRSELRNLLDSLTPPEQAFLLARLMAKTGLGMQKPGKTNAEELLRMERELENALDEANTPRTRNSRLRLWFIFMLARHGGLRLEEIFNIKAENLDLANCRLCVEDGASPRQVPLPAHVAKLMREKAAKWPALLSLERPFRCDSSLVRRALSKCAAECGIFHSLYNIRALRRHRGLELEYTGLPPALVNLFLGRQISDPAFNREQGEKILYQSIVNSQFPKTSARNAFRGNIVELIQRGILVETCLESAGGLLVYATITDTSRQNLNLEIGMPVTALVKAPLVNVFKSDAELCGEPNHFYGKVMGIKQDEDAMEIIVLLPQGNIVCALYTTEGKPDFPISPDDSLGVEFSPFSVILTLA